MIRPFTCLCLMFAAGSGLFLYNSKHSAQMVDQETAKLIKSAQDNRARAVLLRAEYDRLGDPERLQELASQVLTLVPTDPKQFASLTDLDKRLPAIAPPVTVPVLDTVASAAAPAVVATAEPQRATAVAEKPVVEKPLPQALAMAAHPAAPARPVTPPLISQSQAAPAPTQLASAAPPAPKPAPPVMRAPAEPKPVVARTVAQTSSAPVAVAVAAARPHPVAPAPAMASGNDINARMLHPLPSETPVPMVASALGMARTMMAQPIPARP